MTPYNGHRSWNAWNVALWIDNTESLYFFAVDCLKRAKISSRTGLARDKQGTVEWATASFMKDFKGEKTPDGGVYTRRSVRDYMDDTYDALIDHELKS